MKFLIIPVIILMLSGCPANRMRKNWDNTNLLKKTQVKHNIQHDKNKKTAKRFFDSLLSPHW
ncbi:MAG: hypothetical protein PHU64_05135 [Candidatus Omnitrophica bacterium]|nr:hypothetical protein [Candidatus Omnitrophota bacterium]MDD5430045.1 hypothetical protein [Candidatus Omnitrophota bacterium]